MSFDISVIVPTHHRASELPRLLRSLAEQNLPATAFEVIVVADGCSDNTVEVVRSAAMPYALRVQAQPRQGAAAARNFGARLARAPLLVFLDDDMEALPGLLAAHLAAQRDTAGIVGLGYFTLPPHLRNEAPLALANALWWDSHFTRLFTGAHRMTFQDLLSGNVALPKALFDDIGGFDESFIDRAGEDYELGARLMARRVPFRFVPEAASLHHDHPTLLRFARRAFAEGRGHVLLARKHPTLAETLPLLAADAHPLRHLRRSPALMAALTPLARPAAALAGALRLRGSFAKLLRLLHMCCYWRGVVYECGSAAAVTRLRASLSETIPPPVVRGAIDLADLSRLAEILDGRFDELDLHHGAERIGTIAACPGAEPLRPGHVRYALVHQHGEAWRWAMLAQPGSQSFLADLTLQNG